MNKYHYRALKDKLDIEDSINILCLGDQSLLGLIAAGCSNTNSHVTIVQENRHMRDILQDAIKENNLLDKVEVISDMEELNKQYSAVVCDAFFTGSVLIWHNLLLWYHVNQLKKLNRLQGKDSLKVIILTQHPLRIVYLPTQIKKFILHVQRNGFSRGF